MIKNSSEVRIARQTFAQHFMSRYQQYGDEVAMRFKKFGRWQEYSWNDCYDRIKYFCLGLLSLGLEPGDKVSILGDNEPYLYWAEVAAMAGGAQVVPLYVDAIPSEIGYIIAHSESKFVIVNDQEQVDKILAIRDDIPLVKHIIYWDPKGLTTYDEPGLLDFTEVLTLGREYEPNQAPEFFERTIDEGKVEDIALILYTSGTTGLPKGTLSTQLSWIQNLEQWQRYAPFHRTDQYLSFISPAWATEQLLGIAGWVTSGMEINFPESADTVQENIREISPNIILYPSRLWESMVSMIQAKMQDAGFLKRLTYSLTLPIGYKVADLGFQKEKVSLFWKALYAVAYLISFRPLIDHFGLLKSRLCLTGGSALGPDTITFFHAIGLKMRQVYGSTEAVVLTIHREGDVKFESVGKPVRDEVKITEEGEIIAGGEGIFCGYYKDPEKTRQTLTSDGWVHTGDAGYIDDEGHLIFWDRLTDLRELASGRKFSPLYIESRLRFSPYIKDAIALGSEDREYVTAVIIIDYEIIGKWAERHHIVYTTFTDLSQKPEVYALIEKDIERLNKTLPEWSRLKRFTNLYKELDPDEAELTRTRKLRRGFVEERYRQLIDLLYSEQEESEVESEVKYRDGRVGKVKAKIRVATVGGS